MKELLDKIIKLIERYAIPYDLEKDEFKKKLKLILNQDEIDINDINDINDLLTTLNNHSSA
jgi:hypothetical protein